MTPGTGLSESTTYDYCLLFIATANWRYSFTVPDTVPIEDLQAIRLGEGLHPVVIQVL